MMQKLRISSGGVAWGCGAEWAIGDTLGEPRGRGDSAPSLPRAGYRERMSVLERLARALRRTRASARAERERRRSPVEQHRAPYGGDFEGVPEIVYDPMHDDLPDPGEVVWAWVPYEEDHGNGKDRDLCW